jgi:hypothetical protein
MITPLDRIMGCLERTTTHKLKKENAELKATLEKIAILASCVSLDIESEVEAQFNRITEMAYNKLN